MSRIGYRMNMEVSRPPVETIGQLMNYRSCDLSDAMNRAQTMVGLVPAYRPIDQVVGPAVTVNAVVPSIDAGKMGLAATREGDVLVVAAPSSNSHAVWGGNLAFGAKSRGVAGLIVDGAIRDAGEIRETGFATFSRYIATAAAPVHAPQGEVNVPIACGGVVVFPGDIIVADEDGIVVLPPSHISQIVDETNQILAKHAEVQDTLARGEVTSFESIRDLYHQQGFDQS